MQTWILFGLLVFLFSNILYLFIQKAQEEKIAVSTYSIFMFAVPAVVNFFYSIFTGESLLLSIKLYLIVGVTAILWSYLGNYFSQKGLLHAPNPDYSLILQKSYVVITTFAAFFLFKSELTSSKIISILLILLFSALISISKKEKKGNQKWIIFSIGAHLCFAFGSIMSKYFLEIGLSPHVYLFYIGSIVSILNYLKTKKKNRKLLLKKSHLLINVNIGLASLFFNLAMQYGFKFAPNPGYIAAINASSIMSITILSAFIFKKELSLQKIIGIIGVTASLLVMIFI